MRKPGLTLKNGFSFFLVLSLLLLLTPTFNGCKKDSETIDPLVLAALAVPSFPEFSEANQAAFTAAVDTAFAAADHKRGISVAVYDGTSLWTYAAGYKNGEYGSTSGTKMSPSTPMYAYSITKTFISALVLKQIDAGLYTLGHTVAALLAANPGYLSLSSDQRDLLNTDATVEQLLMHTSGMPNYADNLAALIPMCDPKYTAYGGTWNPVDILEHVVYLDTEPTWIGDFHYSNTNYILLGMIAEELGGKPLNTLLAENFFTPLDIKASLAPQDSIPSSIAHPYDDVHALNPSYPDGTFYDFSLAIKGVDFSYNIYQGIGRGTWAAGGIIATATNLALWGYELYDPAGLALTTDLRDDLKASAPYDGDYGYGINNDAFAYTSDTTVGTLYGHGGGAPGYLTLLRYEAAKGISVAIMTNFNNSDGGTGGYYVDQAALVAAILNAYVE